jgi:hypothetical protein
MYAQMLVGMVALTGQWWLENSKVKKDEVAAHSGQSRVERPHRPGHPRSPAS